MFLLFVVNEEEEDDDDDDEEDEEEVVNIGLLRLWLASDDPLGLIGAPSKILVDDAFIVVSSSLWVISSVIKENEIVIQTVNSNAKIEMNFNLTVNMEWACMYCQICPPPPLYYHHFDCSLSFSRDSTDTRHLRVFSSARNSLRKRAIQHPDSTHTHLYIYLSSLNKIPGLMLCVSCVFIGTVPLSLYIYSPTGSAHLLPPHLTLFLRFYTTSSLFINFFFLVFVSFWLGRRRLNYFTKERSFLLAEILKNKNTEGIPRHFQLRWKSPPPLLFIYFDMAKHTHTQR
jgi:hypothetical protein